MPTLPNSSKLASFDSMLSPWGPKSVPARINPIMCGILNLFRIGAHRMMTITNRNMAIGSVSGKDGIKSVMYFIIYVVLCKVSDFFWNDQYLCLKGRDKVNASVKNCCFFVRIFYCIYVYVLKYLILKCICGLYKLI